MNLIYIGDHFYMDSRTVMSSIYTEDGRRSDWGFVQLALAGGEDVHIRQATPKEREPFDLRLATIRSQRNGGAW